ncbi:homeobox protein knotted-1-like 1 [Cannabis sativa]|uniref:homeobox protein knotted-1-like 1 n=1 Tax=Cannabis sativa TaxID=3483 RepID=UPI0029CA3387|nr:homeobox protein knotted-1-like 1 [Cannabis sativa]
MGENSGENSSSNSKLARAFDELGVDHEVENDVFGDDDDEKNNILMKKMISEHPLFELLIHTHFNCLKVGLSEIDGEAAVKANINTSYNNSCQSTTNSPDLDKFMEAYCMALRKLKEAMEEPVKDATSFISTIYSQLSDLSLQENHKETNIIFTTHKHNNK